jgi:hypothetical protein
MGMEKAMRISSIPIEIEGLLMREGTSNSELYGFASQKQQ